MAPQASLGAQLVKNPAAMQEIPARFRGRAVLLEEGMATHSSILAWSTAEDRGAWWATVHGVQKSRTRPTHGTQMAPPRGQDFIALGAPDSFPLWLQVKGGLTQSFRQNLRPAWILIQPAISGTRLSLLPTRLLPTPLSPRLPAPASHFLLPSRPQPRCQAWGPASPSGGAGFVPSQLLSELTVYLKTNKKAHTQHTQKHSTRSLPSPSARRDKSRSHLPVLHAGRSDILPLARGWTSVCSAGHGECGDALTASTAAQNAAFGCQASPGVLPVT